MARFIRYVLRTTDVDAATSFYTDVLGPGLRGPDVEGTTARFVALGAQRLGPTVRGAGATVAVLRDPFGAIVALSSDTAAPPRELVAWHLLHTRDREKAMSTYAELFGWTPTEQLDAGPELGVHQGFAWDEARALAGYVSEAARSPGIHTQWLYTFRVADLEKSLSLVRARGGLALPAVRTPRGELVAPCDDAQGAAFAMLQPARS